LIREKKKKQAGFPFSGVTELVLPCYFKAEIIEKSGDILWLSDIDTTLFN
jgi:hypothetical protein